MSGPEVLPVAGNCANWSAYSFMRSRGQCQRCGVPWQECEVGYLFRCPHFEARDDLPNPSNEGGARG